MHSDQVCRIRSLWRTAGKKIYSLNSSITILDIWSPFCPFILLMTAMFESGLFGLYLNMQVMQADFWLLAARCYVSSCKPKTLCLVASDCLRAAKGFHSFLGFFKQAQALWDLKLERELEVFQEHLILIYLFSFHFIFITIVASLCL